MRAWSGSASADTCSRVATGPLARARRAPDRPKTEDRLPETGGDYAGYLSVAVDDGQENWPLLVTQRYSPSGSGFEPGVLLVPETGMLFIGAGTRLLGYRSTLAACASSWWTRSGWLLSANRDHVGGSGFQPDTLHWVGVDTLTAAQRRLPVGSCGR
jgi:hypothetical protein